MTFEIAVGNGVRTVSVTRTGSRLQVTLDGRTVVVDARRVGEMELSLLVTPEGGMSQRRVSTPHWRPTGPLETSMFIWRASPFPSRSAWPAGWDVRRKRSPPPAPARSASPRPCPARSCGCS